MPVERAEHPVPNTADERQRHRMGNIGADDATDRQLRIEQYQNGHAYGACAYRGYRDQHAQHHASDYGDGSGALRTQFSDMRSIVRLDRTAEDEHAGSYHEPCAQHRIDDDPG